MNTAAVLKRSVILCVLFAAASGLFAGSEWEAYFPLNDKSVWLLDIFHKNSGEMVRSVQMDVVGSGNLDGRVYVNIRSEISGGIFSVRTDDNGAYIKTLRQQLPFLSFITYDIEFIPEVCFMKFPLKMGDSWEYRGQAALKAIGVVDFRRNIYMRLINVGEEQKQISNGQVDTYHIAGFADPGGGEKKLYRGDFWFGKNIGYFAGDTDDTHYELTGFYVRGSTPTPQTAVK
jgi:hypothetical protein